MMGRRWFVISLVALFLTGCAATIYKSQKLADYEGKVDRLAIYYIAGDDFHALPSKDARGSKYYTRADGPRGMRQKVIKANHLIEKYMGELLPGLVRQAGIDATYTVLKANPHQKAMWRSKLLSVDSQTPDRKALLIVPFGAKVFCKGGCQTIIRVRTALIDRQQKKVVWQVTTDIRERTTLSEIGPENIEEYWRLVSSRMKEDGLLK
jgi:hypothetical protein